MTTTAGNGCSACDDGDEPPVGDVFVACDDADFFSTALAASAAALTFAADDDAESADISEGLGDDADGGCGGCLIDEDADAADED